MAHRIARVMHLKLSRTISISRLSEISGMLTGIARYVEICQETNKVRLVAIAVHIDIS